MVSLYEEIVGRGGIAPDYFFDRMDFAECVAFLNGMRRKERAELERTRLVMWACLSPWSKQRLSPEDILKLDETPETTASPPASHRETERLMKQAMEQLRERAERIMAINNELMNNG